MKKIVAQHVAGLVSVGAIFLLLQSFLPNPLAAGSPYSMERLAAETHTTAPFAGMVIRFVLVYIAVMLLTYYGAQTLALFRFVQRKQAITSDRSPARRFGAAVFRTVMSFLLFAPGYVIVYSLKSVVDTSSVLVMILLGVVSNGVLVNYSNKFYTLLVNESRRGYVETAIVKNVHSSYQWNVPDGLRLRWMFRLRKKFPGHMLEHIVHNARYQYRATLKEQAAFVITGLVIIEMALNIQGHLCYELLQAILFKQYDTVLGIMFAVFSLVKVTDLAVDTWIWKTESHLSNRESDEASSVQR
jgi:hypothetical protein